MSKLDEFITQNRREFDSHDPPEGHSERFMSKLENRRTAPWFLNFRIAATLIIGILVTGVTYQVFVRQQEEKQATGLDEDMKETIYYYTSLNYEMQAEISELDFGSAEEKKSIMNDLEQFDSNYDNLLSEMEMFPDDERVKNAIIEHLRARTNLLKLIISQIKLNNF